MNERQTAQAMHELVLSLESKLHSAQDACAKLHDLNHTQAQRIEVLEAQCETRAKRIYELEEETLRLTERVRVIEHGIRALFNG